MDPATTTATDTAAAAAANASTPVAGSVGSSVDEVGVGVCQGGVLRVCGAAGAV